MQLRGTYNFLINSDALARRKISAPDLLSRLDGKIEIEEHDGLVVVGPLFGEEAAKNISDHLINRGFEYWDDFCELSLDRPDWILIKIGRAGS